MLALGDILSSRVFRVWGVMEIAEMLCEVSVL